MMSFKNTGITYHQVWRKQLIHSMCTSVLTISNSSYDKSFSIYSIPHHYTFLDKDKITQKKTETIIIEMCNLKVNKTVDSLRGK